ncbi:MAG TPA: PH domain-containing protein [Marinobacter sp.]|uniref:YdbS-like PH domain-containing protein n=1 Tax=marine sediment metagenome TaxID=412755 RepID=A0A0F9J2M3_9ZZZZ|nr:PH domain-containing protein [Marinobacter sp.]HEG44030.1 PH domain-containing protein [Phycisphaerales bacterium]
MKDEQKEETLLIINPAMFRGEPVGFIICVALIPLGIGIGLLLFWWLQCRFTTYTITNLRTIAQTGILSRNTNEVRHIDVRNLQVKQDVFQRMFGFGSVAISSAGQSDIELTMVRVENPYKIADIVRQYQG